MRWWADTEGKAVHELGWVATTFVIECWERLSFKE